MLFMREFYDERDKVKTKNIWVWFVHAVSYTYVIFFYFFTDAVDREKSLASKMWVPLDMLLTGCIFMYFMFYYMLDVYANEEEQEDDLTKNLLGNDQ